MQELKIIDAFAIFVSVCSIVVRDEEHDMSSSRLHESVDHEKLHWRRKRHVRRPGDLQHEGRFTNSQLLGCKTKNIQEHEGMTLSIPDESILAHSSRAARVQGDGPLCTSMMRNN